MIVSTRRKYFEQLTDERNPTIWVTEWMSNVLLDVELSLDLHAEVVIRTCVEGLRKVMSARAFKDELVHKIVAAAPCDDTAKETFHCALRGEPMVIPHRDIEMVVLLAIHCFLHVAFTYALKDEHPQ